MATFRASVPLSIHYTHPPSGTIQDINVAALEEFTIAGAAGEAFWSDFAPHDEVIPALWAEWPPPLPMPDYFNGQWGGWPPGTIGHEIALWHWRHEPENRPVDVTVSRGRISGLVRIA
jgi:hypothetical protein